LLDPDSTSSIVILLLLLVTHAIFAAAREAIGTFRKSRRLQLIEEGHQSVILVDELAEDATRLLTTEQLVLKTLGFFIVALSAFIYTEVLATWLSVATLLAVVLLTLFSVFVTLLFGELIPKEIGRTYNEALAQWLVYPFWWASLVATPLARLVSWIGRGVTGRWDSDDDDGFLAITEEDLRTYVDASEEGGVLKEEEKEMIYSIFELGDTAAREVMVPRIDMVAVEVDDSPREAMQKIMDAGHSRAPVFEDKIDNVVGILYVKDLLGHWLEHDTEPTALRPLLREVYYVPESKPVSDLLRELRLKRVHIAIVVDEYGGTAGLVTIEDILEEIVGEIQDEHDAEEFFLDQVSETEYIFSARMDLDDINDMMDIQLPTEDSDTIGGLVYNSLGRIPHIGDVVAGEIFGVPDMRLTVLEVDGRRIQRVKVEQLLPPQLPGGSEIQPETGESQSGLFQSSQNSVPNS
jgi:putative hemolysin